MLEHAEVSIAEASRISESAVLKKTDGKAKELESMVKFLESFWTASQLPKDVRRLAENVIILRRNLDLSFGRLKRILDEETQQGKGAKIANLSPYGIVIQSILNQAPDLVRNFLNKDEPTFRIVVPREVEIPPGFTEEEQKNILVIDSVEV